MPCRTLACRPDTPFLALSRALPALTRGAGVRDLRRSKSTASSVPPGGRARGSPGQQAVAAATAVRPGLWEAASLARALRPPALSTRVVQEPNLPRPQPTAGPRGGHILIGPPTHTEGMLEDENTYVSQSLKAAVNPTELLPLSCLRDIVSLPDRVQASDLDLEA